MAHGHPNGDRDFFREFVVDAFPMDVPDFVSVGMPIFLNYTSVWIFWIFKFLYLFRLLVYLLGFVVLFLRFYFLTGWCLGLTGRV